MWEAPSNEVMYRAYGKTWRYYSVERFTNSWGINTSHGIIGKVEDHEQFVYLVPESGEKIAVHERIYALQRDGSYKKIECCTDPTIQARIFNFDGKLIVYFKQTRKNTTDCFIYPEGHPGDENEPDPGKRYRYAQLFGEFDPKSNVFHVREFLAKVSASEFREKVPARASSEQTIDFFYANRRPFICDQSR